MMLDAIRGTDMLPMPIPGDLSVAMIATRGIGVEAARRLAALDFDGHHIKELLGPRDYTLNEVASIVGAAIGKPDLPFVTVPEEAAAAGFEQMGAHPATVATFMEMYRGFADGRIVAQEARSASNTTPTTLEEFAVGLAAAYGA